MLYILITGACLLQARVDQSDDQCESQFISFIWIFDFSELRDMHSYKVEEDQRFSFHFCYNAYIDRIQPEAQLFYR